MPGVGGGRRAFTLHFSSTADPRRLFALLSDAPGWPSWFPALRQVRWSEGGPAGGAGAVRLVRAGPVTVQEHVLAETAGSHHAYSLRTVIPVREHRADVWFLPMESGTHIRWESVFRPKLTGTGGVLEAGLSLGIRQLARALIRAAESPR